MYRNKTIILRPCKEDKVFKIMDEIQEVPVNYKIRERMRMTNHPMNVWVKSGPNTECNHYLQKCRPLKILPMIRRSIRRSMKRPMMRRSIRRSMKRSMKRPMIIPTRRRSMKLRSMRRRSIKRRKKSSILKLSPSLIKSVNKAIHSRRRNSRSYYKIKTSPSKRSKKSQYRRRSKNMSRRRKSNCVKYI